MKKIVLCILAIVIIYFSLFTFLKKFNLKENNTFTLNMLNNSNYYFNDKKSTNNILLNFISLINGIDLDKPDTLVLKKFYRTSNKILEFSYIQNEVISSPQVFIYTTHETEGYIDSGDVRKVAYILQEKLNELGIMTVVSSNSVSEYIKTNNLTSDDVYLASRTFVANALENYKDLKLIIDLHRDGVSHDSSTKVIDDKSYAKVMFVINENLPNMKTANDLNEILSSKLDISKGIYHKKISNFNQDLSENVILIEMGGNNNTFSEVENSIPILADSIKDYVNEKE